MARAIDWYEDKQSDLGLALLSEVATIFAKLERREIASVTVPGVRAGLPVRRALLERFPYSVIFLERGEHVHVIAVAHHKRRPGYWSHRLRGLDA
jgi:hypothetical protein